MRPLAALPTEERLHVCLAQRPRTRLHGLFASHSRFDSHVGHFRRRAGGVRLPFSSFFLCVNKSNVENRRSGGGEEKADVVILSGP